MRAGATQNSSRPGTKFSDFGKGSGGKDFYTEFIFIQSYLFIFLTKDDWTVRVSNLPEEATEQDLTELFKPFGKTLRIFLAKDKSKQISRGFAFVTFMNKEDAQRAIWGVNDYGYNHLILKVEWAK
jgi:RNA recognition motif-containing protein